MYWLPWILPGLLTGLVLASLLRRRSELRRSATVVAERFDAQRRGSAKAELQHPVIDLSKCFGCGACVRACPEEGVLGLAYGQAVVVHGSRCVGHARCVDVCPGGAIRVDIVDMEERQDLPIVDDNLEAIGVPGLFLAGELTGFALVKTAILHGTRSADAVADRVGKAPAAAVAGPARGLMPRLRRNAREGAVAVGEPMVEYTDEPLDLLIVGLRPAGLAAALQAKARGLRFLCIEQQPHVGGTVASYPRRKLVMTQPVDLPLHGRLQQTSYYKEELVELWQQLAEDHRLPITTSQVVQSMEKDVEDVFDVRTANARFRARHVILALGRRGTPRKLGVPGEDLPKVCYGLIDAESYAGRHVLVVGGGDSAVEAALALAEQPDTTVTVSYRREAFFRLKAKNEHRMRAALDDGRVRASFQSQVQAIHATHVVLQQPGPDGSPEMVELRNDDVFVLAGGTPPVKFLQDAGVTFDPDQRPPQQGHPSDNNGLLIAFSIVFGGSIALLLFVAMNHEFYTTPPIHRQATDGYEVLRPQGAVGLAAGLFACVLFAVNLAYLIRRSRFGSRIPGSLQLWMNLHVGTGLMSLLFVCLHCGFHVRDSVGGHAMLVLVAVVAFGAVGRWIYALVPRLQNGRQADLDQIAHRINSISGEWDKEGRAFGSEVRQRIENLAAAEHWQKGFLPRLWGLVTSQVRLLHSLRELRQEGQRLGIAPATTNRVVTLARRAHRLALQMANFDELRAIAGTWRWLHRWLSLLLIALTWLHVLAALRFGGVDFGVLRTLWGGS
jgi:thioredoxin reductase/NAD-dependent dihydropyrimidine dehydrogenase PreA subunit